MDKDRDEGTHRDEAAEEINSDGQQGAGRCRHPTTACGAVGEGWRDAFRAVPRQLFVPDAVWTGQRPPLRPVVRQDDPAEWLSLVYFDVALVTQVDDSATPSGKPGRYPSSSISQQPSLVAMMLARTQLAEGHRVLEIGTGTGYNAALLAHRLGAATVTSIEIDPLVADSARSALEQAGFGAVTVITGDGALGHPAAPPTTGYSRPPRPDYCRFGLTVAPPVTSTPIWTRPSIHYLPSSAEGLPCCGCGELTRPLRRPRCWRPPARRCPLGGGAMSTIG